jgi:hypothetical protein
MTSTENPEPFWVKTLSTARRRAGRPTVGMMVVMLRCVSSVGVRAARFRGADAVGRSVMN